MAILPAAADEQTRHNGTANGTLRVHVIGLHSSRGKVHCTLFNSPDAFPDDDSKAFKDVVVGIRDEAAWCDFESLPPGEYAIVTFHDENGNGKFDTDALGFPAEGYAFSNNVRPVFSRPNFEQCAFEYRGGEQLLKIRMRY